MRTREISNVIVGPADTTPSKPAHVRGVRQGNEPGRTEKMRGFFLRGWMAVCNAERSTGINPKAHDPIDPTSPNLPPC
jgi:hypothetical protein